MKVMKEVTAAIIVRNNKVLIARRAPGENLEGKWEFPGGKIELGETPEHCLQREIHEELDIYIDVLNYFGDSIYDYANGTIRLMAFRCQWLSGELTLRVHSEIAWVNSEELDHYDFAPADIPLVEKLKSVIKS
jgi:8-oxo-dGTP diphosphatase